MLGLARSDLFVDFSSIIGLELFEVTETLYLFFIELLGSIFPSEGA